MALAAHAFVLAVGVTIPFSALMLIAGPLIYQAMGGRGAKLDLAIPIKGACALGFANHTDVGPYRIYEGAAPRLLLCASTRNGLRQVEMTGLAQATRMEAPCPQK